MLGTHKDKEERVGTIKEGCILDYAWPKSDKNVPKMSSPGALAYTTNGERLGCKESARG